MPTTTIQGKIETIFPEEITGKGFEKRVFYVEEQADKYPNIWQLEAQQGMCNNLDYYKVGQMVECTVEVRGRRWVKGDKEYMFTTLKLNDIRLLSKEQPAPAMPTPAPAAYPTYGPTTGTPPTPFGYSTSDQAPPANDDLPF